MKEIMMPVLVLDDDCKNCEYINIESEVKGRVYANEECVHQEIVIKCVDVYRCRKLLKRLEEK